MMDRVRVMDMVRVRDGVRVRVRVKHGISVNHRMNMRVRDRISASSGAKGIGEAIPASCLALPLRPSLPRA